MTLIRTLSILILLLVAGVLRAQNLEYGMGLDTTYMMIGDQQHLSLQVKGEQGVKIAFPRLRDTVAAGVEIIAGPFRDSVKQPDGRWLFEEKYLITAFDSGVYVIPSMPITVESGEFNTVLRTDPVSFVVNTYQVDEQKGNYDIVMPYAAPWNFAEILPYLLWGLLGLALIGGCVWLIILRRKKKSLFAPRKEEIPPFVKAIQALDQIRSEKLWQAGKEKLYYTKLTDTVRQYLDDEFHIPAMEQTSPETIRSLENCQEVGRKDRERLAELLETADFVKFAKYTPLQDESARYLDEAYDIVNNSHQRLVQEMAEQQAQEAEERKKSEGQPAAGDEGKVGA